MIVEHISKKETVALSDLNLGNVFKFNDKTFILADVRKELFNPDDQDDTVTGVVVLEITERGLIHYVWDVGLYVSADVELVELYRVVIR